MLTILRLPKIDVIARVSFHSKLGVLKVMYLHWVFRDRSLFMKGGHGKTKGGISINIWPEGGAFNFFIKQLGVSKY